MKLIELTQGRVAIVDDEDFEWLSKWEWCYHRDKYTGYAQRLVTVARCRRQTLHMHIEVLKHHKLWKPGYQVDHVNRCGCDNRLQNLRCAKQSGQSANRKKQSNNTSKVTGVHFHTRFQKWAAFIGYKRKVKHLGYFTQKKDAIAARRQAEIEHFGEYRHDPKQLCPLWKTGQCPDCAARARELGLLQ